MNSIISHSFMMQSELKTHRQEEKPPVEIPLNVLSASALVGVILNFIEREGTDYGAIEVSLSTKIEQIKKQLQHGDIKIIFDPNTESVTLMTTRQWHKFLGSP